MKSTLISNDCAEMILIRKSKETETAGERAEINSKVRAMLVKADNGVIVKAAMILDHDLAFRELRRRLKSDRFNDLGELFDLMDQMYVFSRGKARNKLFRLAWQRAIFISRSRPVKDIVNIIKEYGQTIHILGDNLTIIDDILAERDDIDVIADVLSNLGFDPEKLSNIFKNRP